MEMAMLRGGTARVEVGEGREGERGGERVHRERREWVGGGKGKVRYKKNGRENRTPISLCIMYSTMGKINTN